jgi:hypothetical protein
LEPFEYKCEVCNIKHDGSPDVRLFAIPINPDGMPMFRRQDHIKKPTGELPQEAFYGFR